MRLSTFKTALATLLLVMAAWFYATSAEAACFLQQDETDIDTSLTDTTNTKSRYDRRIHRYRKQWNSLIPTQHVMQFCGNMGLVSVGIGWDYGRRRQWETQLLFGFVPKYDSHNAKITMTVKQNYIPWSIFISNVWNIEPLQCGIYLNTVFGHDFWTKQPTKYESGYYPFSTRLRPNVFVGERFTKAVPNNRRKYIKSLSFFYELSTNDIYVMHLIHTGSMGFWDLFGLSLGIKAQLL